VKSELSRRNVLRLFAFLLFLPAFSCYNLLMIAHAYARHIPAHARVGRFVADEGSLSWVFPFLKQVPNADVLITGGTARDAVIGRANNGIHVTIHGMPEPALRSWLTAKRVPRDLDIRVPSNGIMSHHTLPLVHDLARRDATANALAYSIRNGVLHDPFNGLDDIEKGQLRAIGDAKARFHEDPRQITRLLRLAAELGFTLEEKTWSALKSSAHKIHKLSPSTEDKAQFQVPRSHLGHDVLRTLVAHPSYGFNLLRDSGLLHTAVPKMKNLEKLERINGKKLTEELETALKLLHEEHAPAHVILATILALFEEGSADMLEHFTDALHLPLLDTTYFTYKDLAWLLKHRNVLEEADPNDLSPAEFERLFKGERGSHLLMLLRALYVSRGRHSEAHERLYAAKVRRETLETDQPKLLRGRDLLSLGLEPGAHLRNIMQKIRDAQLTGQVSSRIDALDFARHLMSTQNI
jgi:tRNA nucleotidyltransferase/poly(A) polymerase